MRGLRGGVVLLVVGAACQPVKTSTPSSAEVDADHAQVTAAADTGQPLQETVIATTEAPSQPAPDATPPPEEPFLAVRDVHVRSADAGRRVVIDLTRTPDDLKQFALSNPPRVVIDLSGPRRAGSSKETRFDVGDEGVRQVRVAPFEGHLRVVLDLRDPAGQYVVRNDATTLIADFGDVSALDTGAPTATLAAAPAAAPTAAPAGAATDAQPAAKGSAPAAAAVEPAPPAAIEPPPPAHVEAQPPPVAIEPTPPRGEQPPAHEARQERPAVSSTDAPTLAAAVVHSTAESHPIYTGQRISLDFKDADIQNVLRVIADVSGMNIIATDDVKGRVTLHLSDVPWDQALDLVLHSNRLEMTRDGNVVRISTVARLKEEREALRAAQDAARELEPLKVGYIKVNYARADDALIDKVKGVLTERGSVTFDDRTNTIVVRDIQHGIDDAAELIRKLDVQSPQVLIEAHLVEATEDFARGLGIQWGYNFNAGPATGNPTGMNFPGTVGIGGGAVGVGRAPNPANGSVTPSPVPLIADFPVPPGFGSGFGPGLGSALDVALGSLDGSMSLSSRLTALEQEGKGKVISRPRVITMNNVPATIQSLTILRVKLPSTGTVINTGTGGVAGGGSTATEKINTGITLVVTPQISADGFVLMNIYAKSSQPDFTRSVDGIPSEVSREANSNVMIQDGNTVVLGGIFRHTSDIRSDGMPFFRNIPGLSWLFKRELDTSHHEELLVFLTPKVVSSGTSNLPTAERLWDERKRGG